MVYARPTGKAASFRECKVIVLAVVSSFLMILLLRPNVVDQTNRLLKQNPTVCESTFIYIDYLIKFWINRIFHLAYDWPVVNSWRNFVDRNSVLLLLVLEGPVDGGDTPVSRQR